MGRLHYVKNGSWDYTLTEDYKIKVNNIDFGKFELYGVDEWRDTLFAKGDGDTLTIYKGYAWDGCTAVPSYDWNLEASLVHDVLYQTKKCPGGSACKATWWQVDRLFLNMMKEAGATWLQRRTYYTGVRTFGALFKLEKLDSGRVIDKSSL